jgi:hypothetical protein
MPANGRGDLIQHLINITAFLLVFVGMVPGVLNESCLGD